MPSESIKIIDPSNATGTDYTSILAWESGEDGDITATGSDVIAVAECRGTADNSISGTPNYFGGWTTDSTHYVEIRNHSSQPPNGYKDFNRYYINMDADDNSISMQIEHLRIKGIQFFQTYSTGTQSCISSYYASGAGAIEWVIDSNIFWSASSDNNTHQISMGFIRADNSSVILTNNMFLRYGDGFFYTLSYNYTVDIYCINNTFTVNDIASLLGSYNATYITEYYRNNLANCGRPFLVQYNNWTDDDDQNDYNFTSTTENPYVLGSHGANNQTFTFENEDTDSRITSSDTGAKGKGQNLTDNPIGNLPQNVIDLVLTDIAGNERGNKGNWDAGAYMVSEAQWKPIGYHLMV